MSKPSFTMSADARLLYQRLAQASPGETVPYSHLETIVSRPLQRIRGALMTARHRALRDDGKVFVNVRGVGLICCTDGMIVDNSTADTSRVRRAARRAVERLTKVEDFAALPPPKQIEHTTRLSILAAVSTITRESSIERVRKVAQGRSTELPFSETIKAFTA